MGEKVAVPTCRFQITPVTLASGKTVRAPAGPSAKLAAGAGAERIWSRIFSEISVMLCVVKTLAAAIPWKPTPPRNAAGSVSLSRSP